MLQDVVCWFGNKHQHQLVGLDMRPAPVGWSGDETSISGSVSWLVMPTNQQVAAHRQLVGHADQPTICGSPSVGWSCRPTNSALDALIYRVLKYIVSLLQRAARRRWFYHWRTCSPGAAGDRLGTIGADMAHGMVRCAAVWAQASRRSHTRSVSSRSPGPWRRWSRRSSGQSNQPHQFNHQRRHHQHHHQRRHHQHHSSRRSHQQRHHQHRHPHHQHHHQHQEPTDITLSRIRW